MNQPKACTVRAPHQGKPCNGRPTNGHPGYKPGIAAEVAIAAETNAGDWDTPTPATTQVIRYIANLGVVSADLGDALELIRGQASVECIVAFDVGTGDNAVVADEYELGQLVTQLNSELEAVPSGLRIPRPVREEQRS